MFVSANPNNVDVTGIFDEVDLPIVIVSVDCHVVRYNLAAAAVLHLTSADIGLPLSHIPTFTDRTHVEDLCARVIAGGGPRRCEVKDGEKYFLLRMSAYPGNERPINGVMLTLMNMTASRASIEQAIREREFAKAILNAVTDPLAVLNTELRVQTANRAFFTMFQVSREETQDRLLTELKHHEWNAPRLWKQLEESLSHNTQFEPFELDHHFPTLGHRRILLEARRLYGTGHTEAMILLTVRDVTERKQEEQTRAHLAAIVESSDDAIISKDLNGVILSWNQGAERLFGYTAEEMIGQPGKRLFLPTQSVEESRILQRVSDGECINLYETIRRRKNGQTINISLSVSPIRGANGLIIGASKIARDIGEQKLRHAQQQQLFEFANAVNRTEALSDLYEKALDTIMQTLRADRASILLIDPDGLMRFKAFRGLSLNYRHAVEGHSPWSNDDPSPQGIVFSNIAYAEVEPHIRATVLSEGIQALAFVPLTYGKRLIGKFMVYFNSPRELQDQDLQLAHVIGNTLAFGIERNRAVEALRESELRKGAILSSALDCLITMDHDGRIVEFNPAAEQTFGYRREEVIGHTVSETIIPPRLREAHRNGMERYLRTGEAQLMGRRVDLVAMRADGTEFPVELSINVIRLPDRPPFFTAYLRDITERRRAVEVLRESAQQLGLITDTAPVYIAHCDTEGRYKFVNKAYAARLGFLPHACIGKYIPDIVGPDAFERIRPYVETVLSGANVEFEVEIPYQDIGNRWMHCAYVTELDSDRTVRGFVAVANDITDHRLAQEQLKQWSQELERRVDERTAELQESQYRLRALATELNLAEQRERQRIATELHDHLQQLLALGRMKLGQGKRLIETAPACVNIMKETDDLLSRALNYTRTLVAELSPPVLREHGLPVALKWLGEQMRDHHITVVVDCESDELSLSEAHAMLLFQSVRELLINAAKHAESGLVTVRMGLKDHVLGIEVQDLGKGFDPIAMASPRATTQDSSKFGLFSIRERMKALGGRFDLTSAPGKGTTVVLELPMGVWTDSLSPNSVLPEDRSSAFTSEAYPPSPQPSKRESKDTVRVLLVDDHAMMRQGLRSVLEVYNDVHIVGEASDGEEAIAFVHELRPSVVIMDINMPKLNGIETTVRIKSQYPEITVIGLSVNADRENQEAMIHAGATQLITKEAVVDELYQAITRTSS